MHLLLCSEDTERIIAVIVAAVVVEIFGIGASSNWRSSCCVCPSSSPIRAIVFLLGADVVDNGNISGILTGGMHGGGSSSAASADGPSRPGVRWNPRWSILGGHNAYGRRGLGPFTVQSHLSIRMVLVQGEWVERSRLVCEFCDARLRIEENNN